MKPSGYNKALLIVDAQPAFIKGNAAGIADKIVNLIKQNKYSLYVTTLFHVEKGSLWDINNNWTLPKGEVTAVVKGVNSALKGKEIIEIYKSSRSAFKGTPPLLKVLKENKITSIDIVGAELHDCVLATALDAFDLGFNTKVLLDCCASLSKADEENGIRLLKKFKLAG